MTEVILNDECVHCNDKECHDGEHFCRQAMKDNSFYKNARLYKGLEVIQRPSYEELEKENAELKERADKADLDSVLFFNQLCKAKEIIKDLSKSLFLAKGIVRDLIDDTVDFKESKERAICCYEQEKFDIYKQAEQFLRESE